MADQTPVTSSSPPLNLDLLRSRILELRDVLKSSDDVPDLSSSDLEKFLNDCALHLESKINQILSDTSDIDLLADGDLDEVVGDLKNELSSLESEKEKVSMEIEELSRRYVEESGKLEGEIEGLCCSLDLLDSQGNCHAFCYREGEDQENLISTHERFNFQILNLSNQLKKSKTTLKTLEDLEGAFKWFEATETIKDELCGLRVTESEGDRIRLCLRTYIPNIHGLDSCGFLNQDYELVIELMEGTMELKHAEIIPNDVHISEIIDAAKSLRKLYSPMFKYKHRADLEWFVTRVHEQIILSKLRQTLVKNANTSRHSFEYSDIDESIVAHLICGVDAFIKVPQGWPIYTGALNLSSLKSSSHFSKDISSSLLCKVVDMTNALDMLSRQSIIDIADRVEEMLLKLVR